MGSYLRCSDETHKKVKRLSAETGFPMQTLVDRAFEAVDSTTAAFAPVDGMNEVIQRLDTLIGAQSTIVEHLSGLERKVLERLVNLPTEIVKYLPISPPTEGKFQVGSKGGSEKHESDRTTVHIPKRLRKAMGDQEHDEAVKEGGQPREPKAPSKSPRRRAG